MVLVRVQPGALIRMEIDRIARIARIGLTDKEKKHLEAQLDQILKWTEQIGGVKAEEAYFTDKTNVFREDEVRPFADYRLISKNFPETKKGLVSVPRSL